MDELEIELEGDLLNTTTMDAENASNLTGRAAATPQGMLVTYSALFIMALGPILIGSLRSVPYHSAMRVSVPDGNILSPILSIQLRRGHDSCPQKSGDESVDRIRMWDAALFPFYASGGLFGLYLFFKVPFFNLCARFKVQCCHYCSVPLLVGDCGSNGSQTISMSLLLVDNS